MEPEIKVIGRPIELGLRLIGLYPGFSNPIGRIFVWSVLMSNLPFQLWDAFVLLDDKISLMDSLSTTVATFLLFIKINVIWINRRYIIDIVNDIIEDWKLTEHETEKRKILAERTRQIRLFCTAHFAMYMLSVTLFTCDAVFTYLLKPLDERKFILSMHFPFDCKQSPYFELLLFLNFLETVIAAGGNGVTESLIISLALHVGTRVDFMKMEIKKFATTYIVTEKDEHVKVSEGIRRLVTQHMRVIDFVEKTEDLYTYISLCQCLSSTLIICAMGYVVLTSLESEVLNTITLVKFSVFSFVKLMEVFCFCFAGEYLATQTSSMSEALYECEWYDLKVTDSKMLMFLITKTQRPLTITAGKFLILKLDSFTSILKTAASYLSVLRTMY